MPCWRKKIKRKDGESDMPEKLRRRAEDKLKNSPKNTASSFDSFDHERLIQEMQVYQIELEMQNEELKRLRNDAELLAEKYIDIYDFSPVGYLTLDPDGIIKMANLKVEELIGLSRSALIGKRFTQYIEKSSLTAFNDFFKEIFRTGRVKVCELPLAPRPGLPPLTVEARANISPSGTEFRLTLLDITKRRRVEEAFLLQHEQYRELIQDAASAIIRWSKDGAITFFNEYAQNFFGYTAEEIIGKNIALIVPEKQSDNTDLSDLYQCIVHNPESYTIHINENIRKDGSRVWMSWTNRPIRDKEGNLTGIMAVGNDITDVKRAENLLMQKQKQLENANHELESYSYSISHDLQAPLRAIAGFSRMILKQSGANFDEETRRKFEVIMDNVKQMENLIQDLLSFSRLERTSMSLTTLNMARLIREVWEEILLVNPGRRLTLRLAEMPPCFADRALVKQVIGNLLSNAVKFSAIRDEAIVEVGACDQEDETVYFIRDNGVGFDMAYYDNLFAIFKTLHNRSEYEGTGVGLALSQNIIKRHGGRIWAESQTDHGTTFYFTLPDQK